MQTRGLNPSRAATPRPGVVRGVVTVPLRRAPLRNRPAGWSRLAAVTQPRQSDAERFVEQLGLEAAEAKEEESLVLPGIDELRSRLAALQAEVSAMDSQIDALYRAAFAGLNLELPAAPDAAAAPDGAAAAAPEALSFPDGLGEAEFGDLGRARPDVMRALLEAKESSDPAGWREFQAAASTRKLTRQRLVGQVAEARGLLDAAERAEGKAAGLQAAAAAASDDDDEPPAAAREPAGLLRQLLRGGGAASAPPGGAPRPVRIVLICGFESFNVGLYQQAARRLARRAPHVSLQVFSDRDISTDRARVAAALAGADAFFGSLLFDYDAVEWLRGQVKGVPVVLVFESALELMGATRLGSFEMGAGGQSKGPPPAVKKVLSLFSSGREEDRMVGYLSFLKVGPKLLQFVPGNKARDLRNWLTIYGYWNQGGLQNVVGMFSYLSEQYLSPAGLPPPPPPQETPATGCLHPDAPDGRYFSGPADYMAWYRRYGRLRGERDAPVVGVLLYRKHVITEQPYIPQLIRQLEDEGVIPVPVFINGVEAHTVVRDQLTSAAEQAAIAGGRASRGTLQPDAVAVDALVSTIGFPLVGGPAGTMEGGRQAEVAKAILGSLDVPYVVAAPLLIQDMASWTRDGVAGLQSVVLYSLPELDGAIDTVPLGGLVGDDIYLVPERVKKVAERVKRWVSLRRKPASERRVAVLLYGFPPGVGATGTAALLNVPKSLETVLNALRRAGYDLGGASSEAGARAASEAGAPIDGEAIVSALKGFEEGRVITGGAAAVEKKGAGGAAAFGARAVGAEVTPARLKEMLSFPKEWGPTEWGPIPFLPDPDTLVRRMEAQWGPLDQYQGLSTTAGRSCLVSGLELGNVFVGVQPLLGVEGDPMRLLFDRDLTPHPQYAAYYKWLQEEWKADVVLHFGMHGTVEWLPGSPLGNTGLSWSDALLGSLPNVYVYAANNPSESIIAKRRGYGTIVSHNVPPYGRAGLYKQLAVVKDLLAEYREDPSKGGPLRAPIIANLNQAGLQDDCPFRPAAAGGEGAVFLDEGSVEGVPEEDFAEYAGRLYAYLSTIENRLFSEGLHVLGAPPNPDQMAAYLSAYFGDRLPAPALDAVASGAPPAAARAALERAFAAPAAPAAAGGGGGGPEARAAALRDAESALEEAGEIRDLLLRNVEEVEGVLAGLEGRYVPPEAGGDLLRDGPGVLPTGRNIHALDPYRMPGLAATERGAAAAEAILKAHREANGGAYPETVAINLWGLDSIKTKGESVAMVLHMVGAVPVKEGTGRIARFELLPLEALGGRPRVDVLCNMSGIFRDAFQNVVELLDDLFARAAAADEPPELNYVKKHAAAMRATGVEGKAASARLFSNPAGDYGSMVNERVGASNWESGEELGDTWAARNAFSYGRGGERGVARPEVLQQLLSTTERVVQEVDSVEYGLTDIQEYYANTGALVRAAKNARGGRAVGCSVVEAFGRDVKPRELEDVLRIEYRSKLLNPRWADAMAAQGSGGAYEISTRMTALLGWGATTGYQDQWTWDQASATYALDPEMAAKLRAANPQAYANVLRRCLEAAGRGIWKPDAEVVEALRQRFAEMDDELEGVAAPRGGTR
ncbi:protoporphyrin IX magnesium chelatase [Raphidocelis subcapitata]|uniref:magnesium chelatase n=1 Tax=Raphidocelis subcapitata TaxID=307507 RepID=A0A2V0PAN0_9CHLO|nr:protoporphyrin IX magnesium chelatase [Raphidocelis subcapitata]|eukprot:GBF96914.1 protoporphyrin IX magnesium chelatase [Raphidocelis subcapitata]